MLENNQAWTMPETVDSHWTGRTAIYAVLKDGKLDPEGTSEVIGWMEDSSDDIDETYSVL